jgi:ADP-heptose:LPS heptosyltransferase
MAKDRNNAIVSMGGVLKSGLARGVCALEQALEGRAARQPLSEMSDFLLLQHATALGSVVHATPLIAALRKAVPKCRIVVAASGMAVEIFRHNPGIDALLQTPSPFKDLRASAAALLERNPLRGAQFATITTMGNERSRIALQAVLGGARDRVGFAVTPELYRAPLRFDPKMSQIANNLRVIGALGHSVEFSAKTIEPRVFFSYKDLAWAMRTLEASGVTDGQKVAVLVTQTSVTQRKSWRPERFQAAAKFLHERYGAHIVFVGTEGEAAAIDAIRAGIEFQTTSVAGKTSLTELTALLSMCDVGLTLDTGTMHLGRAVGLPMVIVAPAWSPPVEWLPVGNPKVRILKNRDMPAATPDYIIDEVSVDEVTEALAELLRLYPRQGW